MTPVQFEQCKFGHQAIALSSHHNEWTIIDSKSEDINYSGNLHALLQIQIDAGDHTLKQQLQTADCNGIYTSKGIQNEFINICGKLI